MTRIVVGLILLAAIVEGVAPGAVPMDLLPLALVILGLVYGWTAVDSDDPGAYLFWSPSLSLLHRRCRAVALETETACWALFPR